MKNLKQLIESFEQKANQDDYAIVSKEDLKTTVKILRDYQTRCTAKSCDRTSLNSNKKADTDNLILIPVDIEKVFTDLFG